MPKELLSREEIVEKRNFFCDEETVDVIYSMMDEHAKQCVMAVIAKCDIMAYQNFIVKETPIEEIMKRYCNSSSTTNA